MSTTILGMDPGAHTGCAIYRAGKLAELHTIAPHEIDAFITALAPDRVIFENSCLQGKVWTPVKGAAALKVARNIGEVDALCKLITAVCARLGVPSHGISPKGKGAKLGAEAFAALTGWTGKSNQHTRDAATVSYPYRGAGSGGGAL